MFIDIFRALKAGQELANAKTWKKRQLAVNALFVLLSVWLSIARSHGYTLDLSEEQLHDLAAGVYGLVGLFNAWATVATTGRIGVPVWGEPAQSRGADPVGYGDAPRVNLGHDGIPRRYPDDDDPVPYLNDRGDRG